MKILITGYKGFIANAVGRYLTVKGHEVEGYDWIPNTLPAVDYYDQIIHLGAITDTTCTDVKTIMEQNVDFSTRLLGLCEASGVNLMYASSASVYGPGLDGFREDSACLPQSPYAWSKYLFDRIIQETGPSSFSCRVQGLRFFNVYGDGEEHKGNQASVFYKFRKQAEQGAIHPFEGSDKFFRDYIHVSDICMIIEKFISLDQSGVWNVGTGSAISIGEVANYMSEKLNVPRVDVPMPSELIGQYQKYTESNNKKLIESIGGLYFIDWKSWVDTWVKHS